VFAPRTQVVTLDKPRSGAAPGSIVELRSLTMDPGISLREAQDDGTLHVQTDFEQFQ